MTRADFDAVIVGAGPAGSAAAILLARGGWSVALIEKQLFPRRKVCGECIAASNLPLLEALGIGEELQSVAGPELNKVAWMHRQHQIVTDLPAAAHPRFRWGRALGREKLDSLLLEQARLAGVNVLQPWSAQQIDGAAGAWRITVRGIDSGEIRSLHARIAIAAHGSWEILPADRQGHRSARRASELFAFKANFLGAALDDGTLPVLALDGGYGGMVVADGGVSTVACCIRRDRLAALRSAAPDLRAGEVVESWLKRECRGAQLALQPASRVGAWLSAGPIDPGIRLHATDGVFRIGNAAGEAHPIVGEGISMALQSAMLLCTHLLDGAQRGASSDWQWQRAVGHRYCLDWQRNFAPRLRLAALFAHVAMRPAPSMLLMNLLQARPVLLRAGASWAGKTRCAAHSPVARTRDRVGTE